MTARFRCVSPEAFDPSVDECDELVLIVDRETVEAGRVGAIVDQLMKLTDSAVSVRRFANRLVVLFDGYNDDPRALCEVGDLVQFMREVSRQWGYWYHFLAKRQEVFGAVLSLLVDVRVVTDHGAKCLQLRSRDQACATLLELFVPMNSLYATFGLGLQENEAMTAAVSATVMAWLGVA